MAPGSIERLTTWIRAGAGRRSVSHSAGQQQALEIYEFEGCPFCRKAREAISHLGHVHSAARPSFRFLSIQILIPGCWNRMLSSTICTVPTQQAANRCWRVEELSTTPVVALHRRYAHIVAAIAVLHDLMSHRLSFTVMKLSPKPL